MKYSSKQNMFDCLSWRLDWFFLALTFWMLNILSMLVDKNHCSPCRERHFLKVIHQLLRFCLIQIGQSVFKIYLSFSLDSKESLHKSYRCNDWLWLELGKPNPTISSSGCCELQGKILILILKTEFYCI